MLARLDKLQDAANAASRHARNGYVTFLLFGLYLAIIFGSTTHEQLLRESPVTLPLLNVGLPLAGFYWVAPALFVLLHLDLLLQFYMLSGKLHRLDRALGEAVAQKHLSEQRADDRRAQLYPFPFSQMLVGRQHGRLMRFLLWLVVWLTVLVLPVVLLLMGQVQFLPYHDAWTTMWLRLMVAAGLLLILIFWRTIRRPADRLLWQPRRWLWHQAKVALPALVVLAFSFLVFTFRGDYASRDDHAPHDLGDPMEEALLDEDGWLAWTYPANWRVDSPNLRPGFWPTQALFDTFPFLQRNLVVPEVNLVTSWPTQSQIEQFGEDLAWQNFGAPPNLRGRDLRYADLSRSILMRGDFRDANLQGADLWDANLQGADLWLANLSDASLGGANLRDAYLFVAGLHGANLAGVDLRGAMLNSADLRGAGFYGADLRGTELARAKLQGADFAGTDLGPANLQGADLSGANLQGAHLWGVDLRGASLGGASLQGADLKAADLRGTSLRGAHLWRTSLGGNHWALADLTGANLDPIADLDAWVEGETTDIDNEATRSEVKDRLLHALKSNRRSDVPAFREVWRSSPDIMFDADKPPAVKLGWSVPQWETPEDYDAELALFLGDLACNQFATTHVARRFAESILEPNPFEPSPPLLARLLASRLAGDDCPQAADLPDDLRLRLEELAAR
ncbi:MAG TPA: pentapeptide repeat-containing protein [Geminicoccaceae bacterium]|nr:pentapeptide repeat-containing protein [Geminicoccaceae bacterium]